MSQPQVSLVIRTKDEAEHLGGVLDALAGQSVRGDAVETIVVDSGSQDDTVAIARAHGARVIEIAPEAFTYGGALNIGSEAASAPIIAALSGHAFPRHDEWLACLLSHFEDRRVACASEGALNPTGQPLNGPFLQDFDLAQRYPLWGYSNSSGGYRANLWRERPFREDLPGTEDKEWAFHWLSRGYLAAHDPSLLTDHDHTFDPPLVRYRQQRREWRALGMWLEVTPIGLKDLLRDSLRDMGPKRRLHPSVWAALLAQYIERRRVGRRGRVHVEDEAWSQAMEDVRNG